MIRRRVIKVGGSLFDLPDLRERLSTWLADQPSAQNIFLAGGGEFCNQVREFHRRFGFKDQCSHELCIDQMKVTAKILSILTELKVVSRLESIFDSSADLIFECSAWLEAKEDLPLNWDLTSDSISALLAKDLAAELCLLKSTDNQSAVDPYFSEAAVNVEKIVWVNLRT